MKIFTQLIEMFRPPASLVLATRELEEAQRELLTAQSAAEFYKWVTQYNVERIKRLTAIVQKETT